MTERRKRGRPRVPDLQERLSTRLPTQAYDKVVKEAARRDQSMCALVRSIILAQDFLRKRDYPS